MQLKFFVLQIAAALLATEQHGETLLLMRGVITFSWGQQSAIIRYWGQILTHKLIQDLRDR